MSARYIGFVKRLWAVTRDVVTLDTVFSLTRLHYLFLILLALFFFSNHESGVAFVLLLVFLTVLLGLLMTRLVIQELWGERRVPCRTYQEESIGVEVIVHNPSRFSVPKVLLCEHAPILGSRRFLTVDSLGGRSQVRFFYRVACEAAFGCYELGRMELVGSDFFGFYRTTRPFGVSQPFVLLPRLYSLSDIPLVGTLVRRPTCVPVGAGGEMNPVITGVREYRPGDPVSAIHWPSLARTGRAVVKEFESYAVPRTHVVCDLAFYDGAEWIYNGPCEIVFKVGLSLVQALADQRLSVSLAVADDDLVVRAVEPGIENMSSLLEWACLWKRVSYLSLPALLGRYAELVEVGDTVLCVVGTGAIDPLSRALSCLARLRELNARCVVFVVDFPVDEEVVSSTDLRLHLDGLGFPYCILGDPKTVEKDLREFASGRLQTLQAF